MNEIEPFTRIGRRLRDEARGVGFEMMQFVVHPDLDGENNTVVGVFLLDEDRPQINVAEKSDPEFDKMIREQMKVEEDLRAQKAREELQGLRDELRDPKKGLGLDDD